MTRSTAVSQLGSEFDNFLFASIGNDRNGMQLSVLSALARLNIDPWLEAATLARLPETMAAEQLNSLIAQLPGGLSAYADPEAIAARLIAQLPGRTKSKIPTPPMSLGIGAAIRTQPVVRVFFINMIVVTFILVSQWIVVSHHVPAQAEAARPGPPDAPSAQMLPPSSP